MILARFFICAMALGTALPAAAEERVAYRPAPDTLALLLQDDRAIFARPVLSPILAMPGFSSFDVRDSDAFRVAAPPRRIDLSGFDALNVSALPATPPSWAPAAPSPFAFSDDLAAGSGWQRVFPIEVTANNGGGYAVRESMGTGRRNRPPRALDATLVFRLDGQAESPPFSVGGGIAAAVWQALPKN